MKRDLLGRFVHTDTVALSPRQRDVLALVCRGESTKRIAAALGVAESVVKHHIRNASRKLGARNRTHAAVKFIQEGA